MFCCLGWLWCGQAGALTDPQTKVSKLINNYVAGANPEWAGADIRVEFKFAEKIFQELQKLSETAALSVVDIDRDFKPVGNVIFPVEASDGGNNQNFFVRARVAVFKPIVFAKHLIRRGKKIISADLSVEARDIALLPSGFYTDPALLPGNEASAMIPENSTIFKWMVRAVPLVRAGEPVKILVKGENFLVKADGVALVDGYLAEPIKVRRKGIAGAQGILNGTLVSTNEVEIISP
ncbi:flagellar basal body P-ring formation protein FlgA [Candidatus Saganbacteria bacterium]|nr:flagellar basal body P-ring formation protein FlgA [Candidatus Saganbacteria bacterium]